jgi:pimeloyl-ACP methyl ester carboxylesterase
MHGDQDEYGSRAHPDRIAVLVPGPVEVAIIENCRHVPQRDKPDEVLRLMSDFIRDP